MKAATQERIQIIQDAQSVEARVLQLTYNYVWIFGHRHGQALMNALDRVAPELYEILSQTDKDCFFDDSKFSATLAELGYRESWFRKVLSGRMS